MKLETFFEDFGHLADAPNGVQKLRELILQLAVQGKLVPQDPNDEPAAVLLAKIKAEKERLIQEKKIRKSEPLPPIEADEVPFDLPQGWEWIRLAEAGIINPRNQVADDQEVSFIPMTLIPAIYGASVQSEKRLWKEIKSGFTHFAEDDVALAKITPCFQNGKSAIMRGLINGLGAGTTELHIFRPLAGLMAADYVLLYLKSPYFIETGIPRMTGTAGQKRVPNDYFSNNPFPLPPLAEQRRIVAKVDQLMALCDELEARQQRQQTARVKLNNAALEGLLTARAPADFAEHWQRICDNFDLLYDAPATVAALRQAILQLAVQGKLVPQDVHDEPAAVLLAKIKAEKERLIREKKIKKNEPLPPIKADEMRFDLPSGWEWVRLGSIAEQRLGKMLDKGKNKGKPYPYLRNTNVQWLRFDLSDVKEMRFEDDELEEYEVRAGDLLICEGGEPGRCAIWNEKVQPMMFQKAIHRVRPFALTSPKFLLFRLLADAKSGYLEKHFTGATIKHFTGQELSRYVFGLPPLAEQRRIVAKLDQLMALCDELEAKLRQAQTASAKLMESAVRRLQVA